MEKLFKLLPDFIVEGKTTKLAVSALIIDTVLAIVLILILGGGTLSKDTLTIMGSHPIVNYLQGQSTLSSFLSFGLFYTYKLSKKMKMDFQRSGKNWPALGF